MARTTTTRVETNIQDVVTGVTDSPQCLTQAENWSSRRKLYLRVIDPNFSRKYIEIWCRIHFIFRAVEQRSQVMLTNVLRFEETCWYLFVINQMHSPALSSLVTVVARNRLCRRMLILWSMEMAAWSLQTMSVQLEDGVSSSAGEDVTKSPFGPFDHEWLNFNSLTWTLADPDLRTWSN